MNPPPTAPSIRAFPCKKCCGSGNVGYRRSGGVCFRCGGDGVNHGAWQDAMALHKIALAKWEAERQAANEKLQQEYEQQVRQRIAAGEPVDWFERLMACLPP